MREGMREKLIELITDIVGFISWDNITDLADYLIENGVVIPVRCPVCRDMRIKPFTLETFCSRTGETVYRDGYCIYGKPR